MTRPGTLMTQMDPDFFFWPSGFLEAWGTEAKQLKKIVFFGFAAKGGKAKQPFVS